MAVTIDVNEFWNLLAASQLLPPTRFQSLITESKLANTTISAASTADWLVKQKLLSEYQSQILLAGRGGPFFYGNYLVTGRIAAGPLTNHFNARHRITQHPVLLEFAAGNNRTDLDRWEQTEAWVDRASAIESPQLLSVFESVVLPHYRFVVSQRPEGAPLQERLPYKGRLPWQIACLIFAQVAAALEALHQCSLAHGAVSPRTIFLAKSGQAQLKLSWQTDLDFEKFDPTLKGAESIFDYLAPEWTPQLAPTPAMDVYAMGCSLIRTISGRVPFAGTSVQENRQAHQREPLPNLGKLDLPAELDTLIQQLLAKDPLQRNSKLNQVSARLAALAGKSFAEFNPPVPATLAVYRQSIHEFSPGKSESGEEIPLIADDETISAFDKLTKLTAKSTPESANQLNSAAQLAKPVPRRKKNRWQTPATVLAGTLLFSAVIGFWAINASKQILTSPPVPDVADSSKDNSPSNSEIEANPPLDPVQQQQLAIAALPDSERPIILQRLVDDDRESLWESPTLGAPIDLSGLPSAPKMIFIFRPAEIVGADEGVRLIQSLGPGFRSLLETWLSQSGLEISEVEQLIVSLHTTADFKYQPFFHVITTKPVDIDRLLLAWQSPIATDDGAGSRYYVSEATNQGYYLFADELAAESGSAPDSISRFSYGPKILTADVASHSGASLLAGPLKTMADWTDRDRHINVLFLRTALINDEGQQLMGDRLQAFNRELAILIPDSVTGGLISLHLEAGTFFEMMLTRNLDLKADELTDQFEQLMRSQRERLIQFVMAIPPSPYWDKVRVKYGSMLTDFFRNLRWGVEHEEVIVNGWLPPMAAHNLLAATELVISFSSGSTGTIAPTQISTGPRTIAELLDVKRNLNIANPPDLNLLMADIETEINEDFPGLPFKFRIRLMGADLQLDGITKNQRPSALNIQQQTLAEILTQIMTAANPSKDITGPADPACKLVWVVADDPESPGEQAVLITTRDAATKKSYELPPAFRQP